jgi:hypothetical protein
VYLFSKIIEGLLLIDQFTDEDLATLLTPLPINMSLKEEANTLDHGPLPSSDVAESHLAALKAY